MEDNWGWAVGGIATVAATVAIITKNNGNSGGHSTHAADPVTPDTPTTPDTPPEPPKGDDIVTFANNVVVNKTQQTLQANGVTWSYLKNADGSYTLTNPATGGTVTLLSWTVNADNTVTLEGRISDNQSWTYDSAGKVTRTISGSDASGSAGTVISGDGMAVVVNGDASGNAGGVATKIEGNGNTITNNGSTSATGAGAYATTVSGNDNIINNPGAGSVSDGATGTRVSGDNNEVNIGGTNTVSGADSVGTRVEGDGNTVNNSGIISVSGGATGTAVSGDGSRVNNDGTLNVSSDDAAHASTGVQITGNNNALNQTGAINVGDFSTGLQVSGENNRINLASPDLKVFGMAATGVAVSGSNNSVTLTGDLLVDKDQKAANAEDAFYTASRGIAVSGANNQVVLDGNLNVVIDTETTAHQYGMTDGSQESIQGVNVTGDGNSVTLKQGMTMTGEAHQMADGSAIGALRSGPNTNSSLIVVDGRSSVFIEGASALDGIFPMNPASLAVARNGGYIELADGATFSVGNLSITDPMPEISAIMAAEAGSTLVNNGSVSISDQSMLAALGTGAHAVNSGTINIDRTGLSRQWKAGSPLGMDAQNGGQVTNNGTIVGQILEAGSVYRRTSNHVSITAGNNTNGDISSIQLMGARYDSAAVNQSAGTLEVYGRGIAMGAADNSTADNYGAIVTDGQWRAAGDVSVMDSDMSSADANSLYNIGAGIAVGHKGYGPIGTDAVGTNRQGGTITVSNAGAGMLAYGTGNTVINQGVISLETNGYYDASENLPLVGMAAYKGGTAINDVTGVINVNAGQGKAFDNDGTSIIVNYGLVCFYDACQSAEAYTPMDSNVSLIWRDGDVITAEGGSLDVPVLGEGFTDPFAMADARVTNAGAVTGGVIIVKNKGHLTNASTGSINSVRVATGGEYTNQGSTTTVSVDGGVFNNAGVVTGKTGTTVAGSVINNGRTGSLSSVEQWSSVLNNEGTIATWKGASPGAVLNNQAAGVINNKLTYSAAATVNNAGTLSSGADVDYGGKLYNEGKIVVGAAGAKKDAALLYAKDKGLIVNKAGGSIVNGADTDNAIYLAGSGTLVNQQGGTIELSYGFNGGAINLNSSGVFINDGALTIVADGSSNGIQARSGTAAAAQTGWFWNQDNGQYHFTVSSKKTVAVDFSPAGASGMKSLNEGTITVSGNNAVAMQAGSNAQMVNKGVINLGAQGTGDKGMVAMQLASGATADAVVQNDGTINIYASDSYAFSKLGANGHVVNNGTVVIADGVTGSGLIKQGDESVIETGSIAAYTLPTDPSASLNTSPAANSLKGYVVGTRADGSAGRMMVSNASMDGVSVNTGFTAGTAETRVTFDNVVQGNNLTHADAITSTSVVWTAQGSTDATGNVDVTMSKNDYAEAAADRSVNSVASALDTGYTNNALYSSLNLSTSNALSNALKQVSGSMANDVSRDARMLSNRFDMLVDNAAQVKDGLSFNVVAQGDPRAELTNNTKYDMMALRKTLTFGANQTLNVEYGIARLNGSDGDISAGDNGITGGYSQFFGLAHSLPLGEDGLLWNNALRYDVHQLDSSRSISYGGVSETARASVRQQYLELRSEGKKIFTLGEGFSVAPYAGVKLRHTLDDGYRESNAGDFNLNMSSATETAVDSVAGLKLSYAGKEGWAVNATLEGGPNLSFASSGKTASLQGAAGQRFDVNDGQQGGGINGLAQVGVKYSAGNTTASLDAFHWREDGQNDKGLSLNYKVNF